MSPKFLNKINIVSTQKRVTTKKVSSSKLDFTDYYLKTESGQKNKFKLI